MMGFRSFLLVSLFEKMESSNMPTMSVRAFTMFITFWVLIIGSLMVSAINAERLEGAQSVTRVYSDGSAVCYSDGRNLSCVPN
jgi:phosphatidylserine synthase